MENLVLVVVQGGEAEVWLPKGSKIKVCVCNMDEDEPYAEVFTREGKAIVGKPSDDHPTVIMEKFQKLCAHETK